MEVPEFPRLLFHRGQTSLAAALITIQESQAWLLACAGKSLTAALGTSRAETELQGGWAPKPGESRGGETAGSFRHVGTGALMFFRMLGTMIGRVEVRLLE